MDEHRRDRRGPARIPVRGTIGLGLTAAGLAVLLTLRSPGPSGAQLALLPSGSPEGQASATDGAPTQRPTTGPVASPAASPGASPAASPGASPAASPGASPAASPGASPVASDAAESAPAAAPVTVAGDAYEIRWGTVQVAVTVADGVIVDVQALELPSGDRRSASLSDRAEPRLREAALEAQSADIDTVSGATYTSRAYAASLQSALDQLAAA
jgi:uncharacterized protein with FMN-binding domain